MVIGEARLCPNCKNLSLKLTRHYKGKPDDPDPYMRGDIYHWRCACGYGEYL